jgi:hypothetical protein
MRFKVSHCGWLPDLPDHRDLLYAAPVEIAGALAQWFIVRNSPGRNHGMNGYFTLPYDCLTDENLSSDFWTIRAVQ